MTPRWTSASTSPCAEDVARLLGAQVDLVVLDVLGPAGERAAIEADRPGSADRGAGGARPGGRAGRRSPVTTTRAAVLGAVAAHQKTLRRSRRPRWIIDWIRCSTALDLARRAPRRRRRDRRRSASARRSRAGTSPAAARAGRTAGTARSGTTACRAARASGLRLIAGACSSAPITATGTIGVPVSSASRMKPRAEVCELVALRERLGDAARALGEDQDRLLVARAGAGSSPACR